MKILLLFCFVTLITTGISEVDPPPTAADTTTLSTEPTTTATPTTTSTTEKITTTEAPTTTSTQATTTSTQATTTSTKEPSTTPFPITTTTKIPDPKECTWNLTCIRADLKMSFIVPIEDQKYQINLGCNANSEMSNCSSNETQILVLSEDNYNLTMVFEKEDSKFSVKDIIFGYKLPAGEDIVSNNSTKLFNVKVGNSYLCKTESSVHLDNVTMQISEIRVQAFLQKDEKDFGSAQECDADDKVSDVVPIAVGVALAALIIIVLIAYLVGRRRSRQKGYQSV